jgi:serine/threonine protein kinase
MNSPIAEPEPAQPPKAGGRRFTYASGAKPLPGYTIKRGVGHGGFGEVYYAVSDAGKETALKLIRRNLDVEIRGVTQCLNLKHPNLLTLYDIREDEHGDSWVVMEYVSGESLEEVIARNPNGMPVEEALRWFHGIAAGCAYLHDHGIVHRDLKPGNIFLDEGIVKIGDYGLAKFISCSRRSGQTESVGTVHYMAPEIANGRYGKEVDLYALGIILYEMLTGHVPFDGESVGEVLMKHLTAEPSLDRVAEPYRTAISRALTKDPQRRIHSAAEMAAALPGATNGFGAPRPLPAARLVDDDFNQLKPVVPPSLPPRAAEYARPPGGPPPLPGRHGDASPFREPIARALHDGWRNLRGWWASHELRGAPRVLVAVAAVMGLLFTIHIWVPLLLVLSVVYGIYWVVREVALGPGASRALETINSRMDAHGWNGPRSAPPPDPIAAWQPPPSSAPPPFPRATVETAAYGAGNGDTALAESPATSRRERLMRRRQKADAITDKSFRQRLTELTGAMLLSPLVVMTIGLIAILIGRGSLSGPTYVWLTFVATLGAWTILVPAKCWEGRDGEPILRRFTLMVLGLGLGLIAWGLQQWFFVDPQRMMFGRPMRVATGDLAGGFTEAAAYAVYFGFLFLVPAWWQQADASRPGRINVFATAWVAAWAYILSQFWPFPQPLGAMVAATISIALQMASQRNQKQVRSEAA